MPRPWCCDHRSHAWLWVVVVVVLGGCKSKQPADTAAAAPTTDQKIDGVEVDSNAAAPTTDDAPPIGELRVAQEVLLHAALYRAAFRARVGEANHFIIEPVHEAFPPNLGVDPADFRARVLEQVRDLRVPIEWAPSTWRTHVQDVYPGTEFKAMRLSARIISRDEDQATVTAEIGDQTADSRSSRQTVNATWDGKVWHVRRSGALIVW